ncbi:nascent polypeptide-associated complex protein [Halorhabdus sp. CBA1104]|uniref:nascent polypeptide-associated complex protein n=1 Tax=unclassified Halorhabdus TaxID=2621901 RepID=UPI0012B24D4D|nr:MULTISPECIES: nascent polypeptide-associated complex protein [unclassified Halorhabdus]QGN06292.1 nascent polypeptide-associated complex protein [Halorhabdus sp. CBA1104]
MFGGGGGGLNPQKMKQMMEQMGIDMEDIDAEEVIIKTPDGDLVFDDAEVQLMEAQGQKTYQIVGEPERRDGGASEDADTAADDAEAGIPQADVDIVVQRAGVDEATARQALEEADGDLAAAVANLE